MQRITRRILTLCLVPLALLAWSNCRSPSQPTGAFFDSAGIRLSYAIDRPSGAGPFPGIVLVHEGGQVTKESLAALGSTLAGRGFMVLRYDKRGVGQSAGTFEEVTASNSQVVITRLAGDVVAAVQSLRSQSGINAARIGLVGVSQAGWVMTAAASQSADVRFFGAVVGPAVPVGLLYHYVDLAQDGSRTFDQLSALLAAFTGPPGFDPQPLLQSLTIPTSWQLATEDRVVPTRESAAFINGLIGAGRPVRLATYPGTHDFRTTQAWVPDLLAWLDTVR